jgi:hypothetical protein
VTLPVEAIHDHEHDVGLEEQHLDMAYGRGLERWRRDERQGRVTCGDISVVAWAPLDLGARGRRPSGGTGRDSGARKSSST